MKLGLIKYQISGLLTRIKILEMFTKSFYLLNNIFFIFAYVLDGKVWENFMV